MLACLGLVLLFSLVLSLISAFAHQFGYGYVPSKAWTTTSSYFRVAAGIIATGFVTGKFVTSPEVGALQKILGIFIVPFIGYFLGSAPILAGVPMLVAAIAGHHVELIYTVTKADSRGGRGCYSPIELRDLPWFFDSLCYVPNDLRQPLKPGMQIVVEGRGTSLGVYAKSIHRLGL
ncbi:hypothetical protein Rhsp01_56030 [Rhizobium sp. NBRC 114257]|nr:hypothetical protein Rhsp01_56030 [Rhizobium sp. NBRC 114257]